MSKITIDTFCLKKLIADIETNSVSETTLNQLKRLVEVEEKAERQRQVRKALGRVVNYKP